MKPSRKIQRGFGIHPDWAVSLNNLQIVLVGTTHPGNIGAVARVMKNMGLKKLILVSSTECGPETEAFSMSSGAYEIVETARRGESLHEALAESLMAVGTSARLGGKRVTALPPEKLIPMVMERAALEPVSIVFGRESRGLTNEELKLCTHHMIIPTHSEFASMNVANAAAVVSYEVFKIACRPIGFQARRFRPASVQSREQMYGHIEKVLIRAGFLDASNPLLMMRDIRRILNSAEMDDRDITIVRGMFRKIDNMITLADKKIVALEDTLTESSSRKCDS
jgi:TrmH family RNA methyltransferase